MASSHHHLHHHCLDAARCFIHQPRDESQQNSVAVRLTHITVNCSANTASRQTAATCSTSSANSFAHECSISSTCTALLSKPTNEKLHLAAQLTLLRPVSKVKSTLAASCTCSASYRQAAEQAQLQCAPPHHVGPKPFFAQGVSQEVD